jgi:hypothetical protein
MESKRRRIKEWLASRAPAEVTEALHAELRTEFPEVSSKTLRDALRESGLPLAPLVEGARQETLESLERTLLALLDEYEQGDRLRQRQVRDAVILAKQHATFAHRDEVVLWARTWLENPPLFRSWVELRKRAIGVQSIQPE